MGAGGRAWPPPQHTRCHAEQSRLKPPEIRRLTSRGQQLNFYSLANFSFLVRRQRRRRLQPAVTVSFISPPPVTERDTDRARERAQSGRGCMSRACLFSPRRGNKGKKKKELMWLVGSRFADVFQDEQTET